MSKDFDLEKHIAEEHARSPFSTYLREIVYGGIDGIVTTFAVVAGFSGAEISNSITAIPVLAVLLFGFANLFADAASMGLGNFLSVRAAQDLFKKEQRKERHEIHNKKDMEMLETVHILQSKGFSKKDAEKLTNIYMSNENYWISFMMTHELEMPDPTGDNPFLTGIATFTAFIVFGAIPLLPYIFLQGSSIDLFQSSLTFSFIGLLLLGTFRWKVTHMNPLRTILETILVGMISAIVAYAVGTLFKV